MRASKHDGCLHRIATALGEQVFDVVELSVDVACEIARGVDADDV